ncbi:hypothetical protein PG996_010814 [Apiospora saccharicola]|uniref:Uncharacterized protein n=1 Tax=Apiospora saccharicola TaxID=335842 RepID=A0ABR1UPP8_9PEZI
MSSPKTYLEDPEFEDQIAPRSWSSAFYLFRGRPSAEHHRFVEQLRNNLDNTVRRVPRFGAELEEQPDGRIRLVGGAGMGGTSCLLYEESRSYLGLDDMLKIIEQPGATQDLHLGDPLRTTRIDILRVKDGVCVVFRAHHSVADGATFAMFTQSVAQGGPLSQSSTTYQPPPSPTTQDIYIHPEMKVKFLRDTYFKLEDKGGPAQPLARHRNYAPPTESRTYRVSKTKCKTQIAENPDLRENGGCTVFEYLAATFVAHALCARFHATITDGSSWGSYAYLWIPVDVRRINRGSSSSRADEVGNAVAPAVVDIDPRCCSRASAPAPELTLQGARDWAQDEAVAQLARQIATAVRFVWTAEYHVMRDVRVQAIVEKSGDDVRGLGVGFNAADHNWLHVNDARSFGADLVFPEGFGRADVVRRHVPRAPGIRLHPTRQGGGEDLVVLTVTLPKDAMDDFAGSKYFVPFLKEIEAAPGA